VNFIEESASHMTRSIQTAVLVALLGGSAACSLDVTNLNQPDRERALAQASDLEALIGGTFNRYFTGIHNESSMANLFSVYGSEMSNAAVSGGGVGQGGEPRTSFENSPDVAGGSGPIGPRIFYPIMSEVSSSVNDGLRTLESRNLTLRDGGVDVTPRARAFARFMQGIAWGQLSMVYDKATVVPVDQPTQSSAVQQAIDNIRPWNEVQTMALQSIQAAITIAQQNQLNFPSAGQSRLWFGTPQPMNSDQFIRLANTTSARILVLGARTPQERAQVDWNRVLTLTANGLTSDFEVVLDPTFRVSVFLQRSELNTAGCAACFRLDYRTIGPADQSGRYQTWINGGVNTRNRFDIVTPDRRITGPTPQSDGAYTRYRADDNGFPAGVGLYRRSAYQWARQFHRGFTHQTGTAKLASADENRLLRAEALLRTGNRAGAAELINVTRTRSHIVGGVTYPGLPPVTATGVPQSPTCVPKKDDGSCGDLMTALRYERMVELAGLDLLRGYLDSRGFGILPANSWTQLPIPGLELEVLGMELYTFGGQGGQSSAVYEPATSP